MLLPYEILCIYIEHVFVSWVFAVSLPLIKLNKFMLTCYSTFECWDICAHSWGCISFYCRSGKNVYRQLVNYKIQTQSLNNGVLDILIEIKKPT